MIDLNPALAFYRSKMLGFYKAAHLDIRTGLAKRELGFAGALPQGLPPLLLF